MFSPKKYTKMEMIPFGKLFISAKSKDITNASNLSTTPFLTAFPGVF